MVKGNRFILKVFLLVTGLRRGKKDLMLGEKEINKGERITEK